MSKAKQETVNAEVETERLETTSQMPSTEVKHHAPAVQRMSGKNVFEEFGDVGARNIVGKLLKFNKGDWVAGQENEPVEDTKMIVRMDELVIGWIRWEDQKPVDTRMGRLIDGFQPPNRSELGHGYDPEKGEDQTPDTSEWELDLANQPRDPWVRTNYLVMKDAKKAKDVEDDGVYTFATSSAGGRGTIRDLAKLYGRMLNTGIHKKDANGKPMHDEAGEPVIENDFYPLVELKVGGFNHKDKRIGWVKTPQLKLISWVQASAFGAMPEPQDATAELAAQRDADIPF